jgi:hypothetical protein
MNGSQNTDFSLGSSVVGYWQEISVVGEVSGGAGGGGGGGDLLEQQGGEHHPLQQQSLRLLRSLLLHGGQG